MINMGQNVFSTKLFAILLMLLSSIMLLGCTQNLSADDSAQISAGQDGQIYSPVSTDGKNSSLNNLDDIALEVFTFHGNSRCYSCIKLEELTDKVMNSNYKSQIESGDINYKQINAQDSANSAIAQEYEVSSISLKIGATIDGKKHIETLDKVWYHLNDEAGFENYLVSIIDERLKGELN
jgi:hypothetical protein